MTNSETRLRDRCTGDCAWHDSVSAEYARDLHEVLFADPVGPWRAFGWMFRRPRR
jgi:hypothetical protein